MLRAAFRNFKYKRPVIAAEQFFLREFGIQANADSVAESGFLSVFICTETEFFHFIGST